MTDAKTEQWATTQSQERAYTAGWRAFVRGDDVPASDHPGLAAKGYRDAERADRTRFVHWSHPQWLAEPRPKRP